MKPNITYKLDGITVVWDLDNNYCEIYNEDGMKIIGTVPATEMFDMMSDLETNHLYDGVLSKFNADDDLEDLESWLSD